MLNDLEVHTPADNPYGELIKTFVYGMFPSRKMSSGTKLDVLTDIIVGSGKVRYGPMPTPENMVSIRKVLSHAMDTVTPINLLVPWGSKKPNNSASVDIAELGAIKTLIDLQRAVQDVHIAGLNIVILVEDVGGMVMFADEGRDAAHAQENYTDDLDKLTYMLDVSHFVDVSPESRMAQALEFRDRVNHLRPTMYQYLMESDLAEMVNAGKSTAYKDLYEQGWRGLVPQEQREYYIKRYETLYPGLTRAEYLFKLATYLVSSLVRYQLKMTGARPEWEGNFIKLNFVPPVPGVPAGLAERRLYYRTVSESFSRTHLPPWRAKGYLKINGREATPKLTSWNDPIVETLTPCSITLKKGTETLDVRSDHMEVG